ncbi:hypothetical protein HDV05_000498 [Chytridiales sp. JEL 0842]|nr:hypothetical protein HDV05_000498 [Chytridiales sp. JEL 0842]
MMGLEHQSTLDSPSSQHPRIATESKDDILYLKEQLKSAGSATIASRIKDLQGKDEKVSAKIAGLVQQRTNEFIEEMFRLASGNVTVNGVSYEEAFKVVDEYEPFNEELRSEADDLVAATFATRSRVAQLRKAVPTKIAELESRKCEAFRESIPTLTVQASTDGEHVRPATEFLKEQAPKLAQDRESALAMLENLKKTITSTCDKWERAQKVMTDLGITEADEEGIEEDVTMTEAQPTTESDTPRRARSGLLKRLENNGRLAPY